MKREIVKDLSKIYGFDFDLQKVFLGNGAQNFVDKVSAFLKVQNYEQIAILESPYHLYAAAIKQNGMTPVMIPSTHNLRATGEFVGLTLKKNS